jgi:hypothetical protein
MWTGLANAEFDQEGLMFDQFWLIYTDVHVFVGIICWVSGLQGSGAEFGYAVSHVFFSKNVMDEPAYTDVEMSVSPMSVYRKLTDCWWKRHDVGSDTLQP